MTTLTFHLSRKPGDEVVVSRLDHDASIRPWVLAASDAGAAVRWIDVHPEPEDCTLDLDSLRRQLGRRTRLVAVGVASNAVGTINDVATICRWAHDAGAWVFIDAVIMPRTGRSTFRPGSAIFWPARRTNFSGRTSAYCGAAASSWSSCPPTSSCRFPIPSRTGG